MSPAPPQARATAQGLWPMLGTSFLLHLAGVASLALWVAYAPNLRPPPKAAIITQLVRLGTPRPKELLPRLPDPPAAPTPAPAAVPPPPAAQPQSAAPIATPAKTAPPAAKKPAAASARDRIREMTRVNQALERLKRTVDGQADGSEQGDAERAVVGEAYYAEIRQCIRSHYTNQGIAPERLVGRSAGVVLWIQGDGRIVRHLLERSSGLAAMDQQVTRALTGCAKVSPPPAHLRDSVRDGIAINFTP